MHWGSAEGKIYFSWGVKTIFSHGAKIYFRLVAKYIFSKWQNIFSLGGKTYFLMVPKYIFLCGKIYLLKVSKHIFSKCQNIFSLSAKTYLLMVAKGVLLSVPPDGGRVSADRETGQSDNLLRVAISLCRTCRVSFLKVLSASYKWSWPTIFWGPYFDHSDKFLRVAISLYSNPQLWCI